jgi:hypothetical protein
MKWIDDKIQYRLNFGHSISGWYGADELQPYKEETIKEKLEQITLDIPDGYEFFGINDDNKVVLTKKYIQYPKTYEECYNVLGYEPDEDEISCYNGDIIESFVKLLICRDAYLKIAGEENKGNIDYVICNAGGKIIKTNIPNSAYNHILNFPTEEMRDAFYENFKSLIEECKELL